MACGLRFLALNDSIATLADLYGMSVPSARRVVNMFLDAVDFNTSFAPLQVRLPDPSNREELAELADRWASKSTAFGLLNNNICALDGWLPRTEMPWDVPNQGGYFSGHYQCFGLNVQAMCDPDLIFLYVAVVAPGKTNDVRAFGWCYALQQWLNALPDEYFISADNAYTISRRVLIPFSGGEAYVEVHRTYNFYLSQLRIRIEMAFGRLTTKWRRLRTPLNYSSAKNAQIVRVCTKLHNYCIRKQLERGEGSVPRFVGSTVAPDEYGIEQRNDGENRVSDFGFLETEGGDDGYWSLMPNFSRRNEVVADVVSRDLRQHPGNRLRNE